MWRWTFPSFFILTLAILCCCNGQFVVVAPNLIRTDAEENVFLQATGVSGEVPVTIKITDYNTDDVLTQHYATLNQQNHYHTLASVQVSSDHLRREEKQHKYINMEVNFGNLHTEKRAIMVSFQAGYIFIQTDKPIYKPEDIVRIRLFVSSPLFKASSSLHAVFLDIKNPNGDVTYHRSSRPRNGIIAHTYSLPKTATYGKWKILARFDHWPQNNFNTTFEVKNYGSQLSEYQQFTPNHGSTQGLPAFNVTLTPRKPYLDVADTELHVDITARYLYGEPAVGTAYVVYGLKKGPKIMRAPKVKTVDIQQDGGTLTLTVDEIKQACEEQLQREKMDCSVRSLVDSYVYIKVSVLTESGGDLVEVDKSNIKIINSPYVLTLKSMQKYFKPGLPFHFTIHVTYHDGTPAHNIPLTVSLYAGQLTSYSGTAVVSINMPNEALPQTITVSTNSPSLSADRQSTKQMIVENYISANPTTPNYLYIHARSHKVNMGELMLEMSVISAQRDRIKEISYLILSKGKILEAKRLAVNNHHITSVTIIVTSEMMSSFRFVAFYTLGTEVVSDSIKLEVSETCVNPPRISAQDRTLMYRPSRALRLKIQGEPSATISLVAVDQAVYLLRKNRFTQRYILDEVESRDIGCTHGSGKNAMGVFSDAGLLFAMKNGPSTESRQELKCPVNARRRRSTDPVENTDLWALTDEDEDFDIDYVLLRYIIRDTWMWTDLQMPREANLNGLAALTTEHPVPDSVTQWSILAVSSSEKTGFCVAEPWTFVVKQPFSVDLKLPFSVARNEQVEIKAVVYNYMDETLDVNVVLQKTRDMCSVAFRRQHAQKIKVRPHSSTVVPYTIVAFEAGKIPIQVAAYVMNRASDRIQRDLNVVVEGVQKSESEIIHLNPSDSNGRQVVRTSTPILKGVVPNSEPATRIKFTGNIFTDTIDTAIRDDPLASLIRMPGGTLEGNLESLTFLVIATLYLERTKGWESVGVQRKIDAYHYIRIGYASLLKYKRSDGSYPPQGGQGPSTWITAHVVKIFTMIYSLDSEIVNMDNICQSVRFLLQNKQTSDGSFSEANPVTNQYITGGLRGSDSSLTLTAFVTIALAEVRQANIDCSHIGANTQLAINRAVPYLKVQLQKSPPPRPYTKAIISYALALSRDGTFDPTSSLLAASSDGTYWPDDDSLFSLEATGYALLALVKKGKLTEAKKPFYYLSSHKNIEGGSANTQSTMVVLHALCEYLLTWPTLVKQNLDIELNIARRTEYISFNSETNLQSRSFHVPKNANIEVVAKGNGMGTMEVMTFYNQLPEEDAKSCENFDMQVSIQKSTENPPPGIISVFELSISVMALGPVPARSVVLDVSLPTGFTAETNDLKTQSTTVERFIDHFYFDDKQSDRSSLIIHLYKVSNTMPHIVSFRLLQQFNVGFLQPSSVAVYKLYNEGQRCARLYSPPQNQVQLITICLNNVCRCAQDDCCEIWGGPDNPGDMKREDFACAHQQHIFKVKVLNVSSDYNDKYEVEITEVFRIGVETQVVASERRFFYSHTSCRSKCQLQTGSQYLIMGPESNLLTLDTTTNKYIYVLGSDTWVERWPTEAECKDPAFEAKCRGITKVTERISVDGCRV